MAKQKRNYLAITFAVLGIFVLLSFSACALLLLPQTESGSIAVIPVHGAIYAVGSAGSGVTTADALVPLLEEANEDEAIDAVILDINSPGGSAVGSDEVAQAVKAMDKPVVAVIREVGASGAYWIASASDYSIANRMGVTGSIGVVGSYFGFEEFLEEYNVSYRRFVSGEKKDLGSPFRSMSREEKAFLQEKMESIHEIFIAEVAYNRNLSVAEVRTLATGEYFLGFEAEEKGLIDATGGYAEALEYLEEQGIEGDMFPLEPQTDFWSELFSVDVELPTMKITT